MQIFVRVDGRAGLADITTTSPGAAWIDEACVFVDGRIDNFAELCGAAGVEPGATVEAALVRGFRLWRESLPRMLVGEFAFVIFDRRDRQLLAARDPFGVRPLFYRTTDRAISISSRLDRLTGPHEPIDEHRVVEYLLGRYVSPERTFFSGVREVPHGGTVFAAGERITRARYWKPELEGQPPTKDPVEFEARFRQLFLQAVSRRLDPVRPTIVHVSGGLDSSAIACAADLVRRSSGKTEFEVIGAAALYPGLPCDESKYIDDVAKQVTYSVVRWEDTRPALDDLFNPNADEPGLKNLFRGGSAGDLRLAHQSNAQVLLSGLGGDQLGVVEGYIADLIRARRWRAAAGEILSFPGTTTLKRIRRATSVARQWMPHWATTSLARWRWRPPVWLTPRARETAKEIVLARGPTVPVELSHVQRRAWRRLTTAETLRNVSMMNIAAGASNCEYRFPFLDKDLVLCALAAPQESWPKPGPFARLHRRPLAEILPASVANRFGKAEFTSAVVKKVRSARAAIMWAFGREWVSQPYVDRDTARQYCQSVLDSPGDAPTQAWLAVWAIVTLEAWLRGREGLVFCRAT